MIKVGWLADDSSVLGGAELSTGALALYRPDFIELVMMPPEEVSAEHVDCFVVLNCSSYPAEIISELAQRPVIKSVRDLWIYAGSSELRDWLLKESALVIFSSHLHRRRFTFRVAVPTAIVHPPVDLDRFRAAAAVTRHREGVIWFGNMLNEGKGVREAVEWADEHETEVHFWGHGAFSAHVAGRFAKYCGMIAYESAPALLASYEKFLFLPRWPEPYGRTTVEAWAAGCELILNERVGAKEWITDNSETLARSGVGMFWDLVTRAFASSARDAQTQR